MEDDAGQTPVGVKGGEGEVSVELEREGVLVFKFAEVGRPRGPGLYLSAQRLRRPLTLGRRN